MVKKCLFLLNTILDVVAGPSCSESRLLHLHLDLYLSGVGVFLTPFLCLALPDAKVNNQSEATKCAMESGDGNTGE